MVGWFSIVNMKFPVYRKEKWHMLAYIADLLTPIADIRTRSSLRVSHCGISMCHVDMSTYRQKSFLGCSAQAWTWNRLLMELEQLQLTMLFRQKLREACRQNSSAGLTYGAENTADISTWHIEIATM